MSIFHPRWNRGEAMVAFPSKPPTEDERRAEFLRLASVPGHSGIYVLGCFARYVTIHAQQVRALNLIDSLAKSGVLSKRSKLAIIGGGIAGLTAAAAAAVRGVGRVVVFERENEFLVLQRNSEQRYVHPHIYDWPSADALVDDAGLPILNWSAERAAEVVSCLSDAWNQIREALPGIIDHQMGCRELAVRSVMRAEVRIGEHSDGFDAVVLAVGFGRDAQVGTDSYWTDSRIDGKEAGEEGAWLVSGGGDGALTDLMRLCISGFRHKRVLEAVDEDARQKVGDHLKEIESKVPPDQLAQHYLDAAASIAHNLKAKLKRRDIEKVWLNCTKEELFRPRSSRLNRLISAWLLLESRFEIVAKPGPIVETVSAPPNVEVHFEDPAVKLIVRHVILRHGPREDTTLRASFPNIYEACVDIEAEWRSARQDKDWTKEPLYEKREFDREAGSTPPLRVDFGHKAGCIVVGRGAALKGSPLQTFARPALEGFSQYAKSVGLDLDLDPVVFSLTDVFANSAAYERTVRALCYSPFAIIDITDYEPAALLLLGIRAATRRGITVTVTEKGLSGTLPFNIGALNPVPLDRKGYVAAIARALQSGFEALKSQPDVYLDLPAYDALRKLGEDHRVIEPEVQILFLRWFDQQYKDLVSEFVESRLQNAFNKATLVTTLDSSSPQLVKQRLYAAIRRTRLCVADWTAWRPNVFFEIGVRLAVNGTDPIFIRCVDRPPDWQDDDGRWPDKPPSSAKVLECFFQPTPFTLQNDTHVHERVSRFVNERTTRQPLAQLSPGLTYAVVKESIDRGREAGGIPVHDVLLAGAKALVGELEVESGNSRLERLQ
jgi:hypothetical protein